MLAHVAMWLIISGVAGWLFGMCVLLRISRVIARGRRRARAQGDHPASMRDPTICDPTMSRARDERDERMDLLRRRFSGEEVERLTLLQLRCRERPDLLDLPPQERRPPLQERRLQFARWLVEQGRIGEAVDPGQEGQPLEVWKKGLPNGLAKRSKDRSCGHQGGRPAPSHTARTPRGKWREALLRSLSGRRPGSETAAGIVDTPHA
jgi:hypothetical protein